MKNAAVLAIGGLLLCAAAPFVYADDSADCLINPDGPATTIVFTGGA
jgi:hypothetical protein